MKSDLRQITYRNEKLVVKDGENARLFLGPDLHLINCEVEFQCSPRSVGMSRVTFEGCSIRAKRKVKHVNFYNARIVHCDFHGQFVECDFGHLSRIDGFGHISDCDFTLASLDDCRFFDCDLDNIHFSKLWPQVVLANFHKSAQELLATAQTTAQKVFFKVLAGEAPEVAAECLLAKTLAKRAGITDADVVMFVEALPFARFGAK